MKDTYKKIIKPMPPSSGVWNIKPDGTVTFTRKLPKNFLRDVFRQLDLNHDD